MTTIDQAARIISDVFRPLVRGYSDAMGRDIAAKLYDAGLLAPDLPAPDGHNADGLPHWGEGDYSTALTWHPCDRDVPRDERPLLIHSPFSAWMPPDELEGEALRALAAVRAARQAQEKA